jgi:hypothetical protein
MSTPTYSLPKITHKMDLPHGLNLSRSKAFSKLNCKSMISVDLDESLLEHKTGIKKHSIMQVPPRKSGFKVLLI